MTGGKDKSLEEVARAVFGGDEHSAVEQWVQYWQDSRARNQELINRFQELALISYEGRKVLDLGCGTGGLGELLGDTVTRYVGADYNWPVLQFGTPAPSRDFVNCDAGRLPFADSSFDVILAFDVIEHLIGGEPHQLGFLSEIKRVLSPLGMILLTTPNFWYPYDAHSRLSFPQYLPTRLADRYIRWRNPSFLREHKSFAEIKLLKPGFFRSAIRSVELAPLHDLPCCLDRGEYVRLHPIRGLISLLGLGWYPHAEFWMILAHESERERLQRKLKKHWFFEQNQPSESPIHAFESRIDFDKASYGHQLGDGWHWHERDKRGFRWMEKQATCYLEARAECRYVRISGFSPHKNHIRVRVDGTLVGEHKSHPRDAIGLFYLIPGNRSHQHLFEVEIQATDFCKADDRIDQRTLGLMIFSVEVC
jgi:SAM-dependent methyltransferase